MNIPKLIFRLLLGRRLPITAGTLEVPGIEQPVLIRRDRYSIPYIEAQGDEDAWYGLGFCHGQDRAFQLEGLLRVVRGTMAELVGPAVLPVDRLSRRIGFRRTAEQQLEILDGESLVHRLFADGDRRGELGREPVCDSRRPGRQSSFAALWRLVAFLAAGRGGAYRLVGGEGGAGDSICASSGAGISSRFVDYVRLYQLEEEKDEYSYRNI